MLCLFPFSFMLLLLFFSFRLLLFSFYFKLFLSVTTKVNNYYALSL